MHPLALAVLGFALGAFGTLVGAGGGFVLMPVFLLLQPGTPAEQLTAVSLAVVFANAASGTIAYARAGRIDYRAGALFALASIPGALLGAWMTASIPRRVFDPAFGALLLAAAGYLLRKPEPGSRAGAGPGGEPAPYDLRLGMLVSVGIGFLASLAGIGGGILHVPALVHLLGFPVHVATATSHFTLAWTSLAGSLVHLAQGSLQPGWREVLCLAPGVVIGAQLGALVSPRVRGGWIIRGLALALGSVGLRLLLVG
ncbi:MAG: sulfite exporter TauE/SafE family protein [Elusimicrobia bacterium]|nr:sulfite exporter TauE/SafE family protein [Elusimicrobiota bacterium]